MKFENSQTLFFLGEFLTKFRQTWGEFQIVAGHRALHMNVYKILRTFELFSRIRYEGSFRKDPGGSEQKQTPKIVYQYINMMHHVRQCRAPATVSMVFKVRDLTGRNGEIWIHFNARGLLLCIVEPPKPRLILILLLFTIVWAASVSSREARPCPWRRCSGSLLSPEIDHFAEGGS